jgi:hypothetical protein
MSLLTREAFKIQVFARSGGRCVFCGQPAVDAHHILDRKLFADGGYYLANGAAVCEVHHWDCEILRFSVEAVRTAAGITEVCVPRGFDPSAIYDKWGNRQREDGTWVAGPLFEDTGARRALAQGGRLAWVWPDPA